MDDFGWNRAILSLVKSLSFITIAIVQPFLGQLIDRFGPKIVMLTVALIMGMSQIFLSVATNIWQITILNIVVGAFWAGGNLAVPVLLGSWFSKKRGIVFGIMRIGLYQKRSYAKFLRQLA